MKSLILIVNPGKNTNNVRCRTIFRKFNKKAAIINGCLNNVKITPVGFMKQIFGVINSPTWKKLLMNFYLLKILPHPVEKSFVASARLRFEIVSFLKFFECFFLLAVQVTRCPYIDGHQQITFAI